MNENLVSQNLSTCCGTPSASDASEMLRKASGPFAKAASLLGQGAIDPRLHHLRGAERDHPPGVDRRRLAGFRVAAHPLVLSAHLEHAEPRQLHRLPTLQRLDHQIE